MTKQNEHKVSNFWIGFSVGIAGAVGLGFLMGTKQGRELMKKALKFSENLEENLEGFIDSLEKQKKGKDAKKTPFRFEDVEEILTKIKQVTNRY